MYQFQVRQATQECFSALGRIRDLDPASMPMPDLLHAKLRQSIDTMKAKAADAGMPREDVYDITYAIVALADEIAFNSLGNIHNYWMQQPLQLYYFHETVAGEGFFLRLQAIRAAPNRTEVLRVFYLCLLFGFQGSHRIRGGEIALMDLIEGVRHELYRAEPIAEYLSPRGQRPEEIGGNKGGGFPFVKFSLGTLLFALAAFFLFRSILADNLGVLDKKVQVLMSPRVEILQPKNDVEETEAPTKAVPGAEFGMEERK